jgi:hypothetical protein
MLRLKPTVQERSKSDHLHKPGGQKTRISNQNKINKRKSIEMKKKRNNVDDKLEGDDENAIKVSKVVRKKLIWPRFRKNDNLSQLREHIVK